MCSVINNDIIAVEASIPGFSISPLREVQAIATSIVLCPELQTRQVMTTKKAIYDVDTFESHDSAFMLFCKRVPKQQVIRNGLKPHFDTLSTIGANPIRRKAFTSTKNEVLFKRALTCRALYAEDRPLPFCVIAQTHFYIHNRTAIQTSTHCLPPSWLALTFEPHAKLPLPSSESTTTLIRRT